jgi:hypothetical protein
MGNAKAVLNRSSPIHKAAARGVLWRSMIERPRSQRFVRMEGLRTLFLQPLYGSIDLANSAARSNDQIGSLEQV